MKKIFFATPIAGYGDKHTLLEYKKNIIGLINRLKEKYEVFAEIAIVRSIDDYDTPAESALIDFAQIQESELFVIHYPKSVPTSALIELGYAYGRNKKIVIIVPNREVLPYLAQQLDDTCKLSTVIVEDNIDDESVEAICVQIDAVLS